MLIVLQTLWNGNQRKKRKHVLDLLNKAKTVLEVMDVFEGIWHAIAVEGTNHAVGQYDT